MGSEEILVILKKDGTMKFEVMNGEGSKCETVVEEFLQKMGAKIQEEELKPEYFNGFQQKIKRTYG